MDGVEAGKVWRWHMDVARYGQSTRDCRQSLGKTSEACGEKVKF